MHLCSYIMKTIKFNTSWQITDESENSLGSELFTLLNHIHRAGRLTTAAKSMGISYRHAWNLVKEWHDFFGSELIQFTRGKGASLTELGEKILWAEQRASARLGLHLDSLASEINLEINKTLESARSELTIRASHGYAVAYLPELLESVKDLQVDLRYLGASESLSALGRGECDLAGFHLPTDGNGSALLQRLAPLLNPAEHCLIHLVTRTQGLFVEKGNPLGIHQLKDITSNGVRFINRQTGSGTRMLIDQMLENNRIDKKDINGYDSEEFTHAAVAAFVASGMADTGIGVQPASTQFGLDFIPLAQERYLFACHKKAVQRKGVKELIKLLKSKEFNKHINSLPGYSAPRAGAVVNLETGLMGDSPSALNKPEKSAQNSNVN